MLQGESQMILYQLYKIFLIAVGVFILSFCFWATITLIKIVKKIEKVMLKFKDITEKLGEKEDETMP